MGMYNEVFENCPNCGRHSGYTQITQLVLGFGNFDLADLAWLKRRYDTGDLSADVLQQLAEELEENDTVFRCRDEADNEEGTSCGHAWRPDPAKVMAVRMLTQINEGDTRERALQMLQEAGLIQS